MSDLEPYIAFFRSTLSKEQIVTREFLEDLIDNSPISTTLNEDQKFRLVRYFEANIDIRQNEGNLIKTEVEPWLTERTPEINFYFWNRLKKYFIEHDILPLNVISRLDSSTNEILDCCGNPARPEAWKYRGMVVGHVQSGKTTNYSALITKAADCGYKAIILMAGLTNSLRTQTQQRLDEYFVGRKSVEYAALDAPLPITRFGGKPVRYPDIGTTRDQDFRKQSVVSETRLDSLSEPKIFIIKKNKSVLENLDAWLVEMGRGNLIDQPLLMIDDEADNASVNTAKDPDRSTTINRLIRTVLGRFRRSSYVGYTATPFANIFIDPDTQTEMLEDDIFPRHFIKSLDPPTNYCGAKRLFAEDGDLRKICLGDEVNDYADILPLKHKKDIPLSCLPESLYHAIRVFVLARTLRLMNGDGNKHCTMMINVSRFNDVQARVESLVFEYLEELKAAIRVNARSRNPLSDGDMQDLKASFDREYAGCGHTFDDVCHNLHSAVSTIAVRTVNMRGGKLDYEGHGKHGLHVIAIGGLALSRGLTLEGLVVTYLLRNVGASDTLMQMARWFGYRPGYEQLCRIYMHGEAIAHYVEIHQSIEELRVELARMQVNRQTPAEFGLKVRQSPTGIRITAANKMRTAREITHAADYSGQFVQGHTIFNDNNVNEIHLAIIRDLLESIGNPSAWIGKTRSSAEGHIPYWDGVDSESVLPLLSDFHFPDPVFPLARISGKNSLLGLYIRDRISVGELREWDIAIASLMKAKDEKTVNWLDRPLFPGTRSKSVEIDSDLIRLGGKKNAVGTKEDLKTGLTDAEVIAATKDAEKYGASVNSFLLGNRSKPLLIIYPLVVEHKKSKITNPCISLAFCLPKTNIRIREQIYQVNPVFQKMLHGMRERDDDEDYIVDQE